jgi:outer membrane protein OmpA-like peptidoglycan-associated protein
MLSKLGLGALLIAGTVGGCASSDRASGALVRARELHQTAHSSPNARLGADELAGGDRLLAGAEAEHKTCPRSNMEKHLANLAAAQYETAMAEGTRLNAERRADLAERRWLETQVAGRGEELTEERLARLEAERKAQEALSKLQDFASVRQSDEGTIITITGEVLFETNKSKLLPVAQQRLAAVADALQANGGEKGLVIEGHADSTGSNALNDELSQARADAVKDFLVRRGVSPESIRTVGRGEKEPIATNRTPEGRANNRRVEIIVPGEA